MLLVMELQLKFVGFEFSQQFSLGMVCVYQVEIRDTWVKNCWQKNSHKLNKNPTVKVTFGLPKLDMATGQL